MDKFQKYTFKPGAMTIIQMGEELIGSPSTAVNELVKNSYDADADKCWVYTQYDKNPDRNFLIIKDNGLGMNSDILFGDWLKPSKSSKRQKDKRSEIYNRRFLGSKGIGRLAAMALGKHLTVVSKQSTENQYNWIRINREDFKVESSLDQIQFPGGQITNYRDIFYDLDILKESNLNRNGILINILDNSPFSDFSEGTTIVIQGLDSSLSSLIEEEFETMEIDQTYIFKSLRDLITPLVFHSRIQKELVENKIIDNELKIDSGEETFELFYGINFIKNRIKGKIEFLLVESSKILDHFDYRIFGKTLEDGSVESIYECKRFEYESEKFSINIPKEYTQLKERKKIREIEEINSERNEEPTGVGEFYFDIRIYDLDQDAKERMVKILKASGKREATATFSKFLGLKVSRNGFGIKPYGDEERDWLGLGAKRVQKHIVSIGPNQIIGNIFLYSPQNDCLKEKTNREGFYENKAFMKFKNIIGGILEETGRARAKYRLKHNLGRKIKNTLTRPDTKKFIQYISNKYDDDDLINRANQFAKETDNALKNMKDSLSFSQKLASFGTGLELVYHELSQPITVLGSVNSSLNYNILQIESSDLKLKFSERLDNMQGAVDILDNLRESLRPAIGKSMPKFFRPVKTFKKVCHLFEKILEDSNIDLKFEGKNLDFEIKAQEYLFWVSFLNILNNAIYWLKFVYDNRIIIFEIESDEIIISNTGPKIAEENLELIFEYGITFKKERNATGLGLSFTKNMLFTANWEIWAENRNIGPSFHLKKM